MSGIIKVEALLLPLGVTVNQEIIGRMAREALADSPSAAFRR